jgi:4-hydroxy-3-methylbut-2-enyl diphosphate reductase
MALVKLNLKTEIDTNSGFCFGVTNAIKKAEQALTEGKKVYCLGQIVHNDKEIERLENKGLKMIDQDELKAIHNKTVLFRAHGEPPETYELAFRNNNDIIDATCPIILKIQEKLKRSEKKNQSIYIFGKHNHPEIIGLSGQINNNAVVFENLDELDICNMPAEITLYSQTTKDLKEFRKTINHLKDSGIKVVVHDTICRHVSNRKNNLVDFCKQHNKMVFIAGKKSSNGKVLFNICSRANDKCFFISSPDELRREWFTQGDSVGIAGATSTPFWLMEKTKQILESY